MSELSDWDVDSKAAKPYDEAHVDLTSPMAKITTYSVLPGQVLGPVQGQVLGQVQGQALGQVLGQVQGQALVQVQGQVLGQVHGHSFPNVTSSSNPPGIVQVTSQPLHANWHTTTLQRQRRKLNKKLSIKSHGFALIARQQQLTVIILAVFLTTVSVALIATVSYFTTHPIIVYRVWPSDVSESPGDLVTTSIQTTEASGATTGPCSSNPCPEDITCVDIGNDFFCECSVCNCTADLVDKTCGTIPNNITGSCTDLGSGFYPVVTDCTKYLWCYDTGEGIFDCPSTTAFSSENPPCGRPSECSVTFFRKAPS